MKRVSHIQIYEKFEMTCLGELMAHVGNGNLWDRDIVIDPPIIPAESNERYNLCTGSELYLVVVVLITRKLFSTLLTNTTI